MRGRATRPSRALRRPPVWGIRRARPRPGKPQGRAADSASAFTVRWRRAAKGAAQADAATPAPTSSHSPLDKTGCRGPHGAARSCDRARALAISIQEPRRPRRREESKGDGACALKNRPRIAAPFTAPAAAARRGANPRRPAPGGAESPGPKAAHSPWLTGNSKTASRPVSFL